MGRAYIRVSPDLVVDKEVDNYPDGAIVAWVKVLGAASKQAERGRFLNKIVLTGFMGRHKRWVNFLLAHKDLIQKKDGSLYVEGWDEWQEGDWTVADRVQRIRNRRDFVTPDVTGDVTAMLTEPVTADRIAIADSSSRSISKPPYPPETSDVPERAGEENEKDEQLLRGLAVRVIEWFCDRKGWQSVPGTVLERERRVGYRIAELNISEEQLFKTLYRVWDQALDKPKTLEYFWQPLQALESETIKAPNGHAPKVEGFTPIAESMPEVKR